MFKQSLQWRAEVFEAGRNAATIVFSHQHKAKDGLEFGPEYALMDFTKTSQNRGDSFQNDGYEHYNAY